MDGVTRAVNRGENKIQGTFTLVLKSRGAEEPRY